MTDYPSPYALATLLSAYQDPRNGSGPEPSHVASISGVVDELVERGFVSRIPGLTKVFILTTAGRAFVRDHVLSGGGV